MFKHDTVRYSVAFVMMAARAPYPAQKLNQNTPNSHLVLVMCGRAAKIVFDIQILFEMKKSTEIRIHFVFQLIRKMITWTSV